MCGRFTLTASGEELAEAFGLDDPPELAPRYNIAPTQPVAVVRAEAPGGGRTAFREAFARRRCLIPASGFFEWAGTGKKRQPWDFRMASGRPFAFAGLWEPPFDPLDAPTATILTTEPNEIARPVHDRMPVILAPDDYARWLDPEARGLGALRPLLQPFPAVAMIAYPVEPVVNDARRDEPSCITPSSLM